MTTVQQLIDDNMDLVEWRSRAASRKYGDEYGEYMTSAYIALADAARTWIDDGRSRFRSWAQRKVDWAIQDQHRREYGRTRSGKPTRRMRVAGALRSIEQMKENTDSPHPNDFVSVRPVDEIERMDAFKTLIRPLDAAQKLVLTLYFVEDMTMKECGAAAGFSESRTSKMIADAKGLIRARLDKQRHA